MPVNYSGRNLSNESLQHCVFRNANFRNATLDNTDFTGTILDGADFNGATYTDRTVWPEGFDPEAAGAKYKPPALRRRGPQRYPDITAPQYLSRLREISRTPDADA